MIGHLGEWTVIPPGKILRQLALEEECQSILDPCKIRSCREKSTDLLKSCISAIVPSTWVVLPQVKGLDLRATDS